MNRRASFTYAAFTRDEGALPPLAEAPGLWYHVLVLERSRPLLVAAGVNSGEVFR
jgi:hypothetical protein